MPNGNDLSIRIKAILDATQKDIDIQLQKIQNIVSNNKKPINIPAKFEVKGLSKAKQDISKATKEMSASQQNAVPVKMDVDSKSVDKTKAKVTEYFQGIANDGQKASKTITEYINGVSKAVSVTEELNKETGAYETTQTRITKNYDAQKKALGSLAANQKKVLNDIGLATSKAFENTSKPIKLDENISLVNSKAQELQKTVNSIFDNAKNDNRGLLKSESAEIDNLIKNYKNLISTIQTRERAANKLRTRSVSEIMLDEPESLSVIESKMKRNKVATEEFVTSFEKLKSSISTVKNNEDFINYSINKNHLNSQINAKIESDKVVNAQNKESESVANFIKTYQEKIRVLREGNTSAILNNDGLNKELDGFIAKLNSLNNSNGFTGLKQDFQVIKDNISLASKNFKLDTDIDKANIKIDEFLTKFSAVRGNPALMSQLSELQSRLETIRQTGDAVGFKTWQKDWQAFGVEVEKSGKKTKSFGDQLKNAANKFGLWITASTIMMQFSRAVENGIRSVVELDKSMTDLRMVTGWGNEAAKQNIILYNQMAKELGISTKAVMEGADAWLRQGRSIEETNQLIKTSTMFARIAQIDNAESTKLLTAALNGYKLEAEDAVRVTDMFNAIDLEAATSAKDLAVAFQYVASVADMYGLSMEKLSGLIAVDSEVTQRNAESINLVA